MAKSYLRCILYSECFYKDNVIYVTEKILVLFRYDWDFEKRCGTGRRRVDFGIGCVSVG